MKRLLCWWRGHRFIPITDKAEIRAELNNLLTGRPYAMVTCERCLARFTAADYLAKGRPTPRPQ